MRRSLALAALVAGLAASVPTAASACDSEQDPRCVDKKAVCAAANNLHDRAQSYFADPLPGVPTC